MKTIPILGFATRVYKKNPRKIDYLGLRNRYSLLNLESGKAKTRRVVGALKQIEEKNPGFVELCLGIRPGKLNFIKNLKELPSSAVEHADFMSKPCSLSEAIKGYYCHYILGL